MLVLLLNPITRAAIVAVLAVIGISFWIAHERSIGAANEREKAIQHLSDVLKESEKIDNNVNATADPQAELMKKWGQNK